MAQGSLNDETSIETEVQLELTVRLLSALRPYLFYVVGIHVSCAAMALRTGNPLFWYLFAAASVASVFRGAVIVAFLRWHRHNALTPATAKRWELAYAITIINANVVLVGLTVSSFLTKDPAGYMLAIAFALAQSSAISSRNPRAWIGATLVIMSLTPIAIVCALSGDPLFQTIAGLIVLYLLSLLETMHHNVRQLHELLTARRELAVAANHDVLTGLVSRRRFDEALADAHRRDGRFAVLMIDLDEFKPVNDRHGHAAGDEILRQVAARLSGIVRASDVLARIGGDEFAALLHDVGGNGEVMAVADRIVSEIREPFALHQHRIVIGASVGAALRGHERRESLAEIKKLADDALYAAKRDGKGRTRLVTPRLQIVG